MFKILRAICMIAVVVLSCVYGFSLSASAQGTQMRPSKIVQTNLGEGAKLQCFALPEEGQGGLCWLWHASEHFIGFYHPNGVGPIVRWPIDASLDLRQIGVSDDGHYAILVMSDAVQVHTLELRKGQRGRLAGISTPRLRLRLELEGVQSASMSEGNLLVVFADRIEVYTLKHQIFLPSLVGCGEGPNCGPTPVVAWPTDNPCQGLSSDPPWCANRTPEPPPAGPRDTPEPTDAAPTPEHGPVVPTRTPRP